MKLKLTKVQAMIGLALSVIALLGAIGTAANYYEPRAEAAHEHESIQSWNELDSIKSQVEILKLKIQRITDLAALQQRPLNASEEQEIALLHAEIAVLNARRNDILKK